MQLAVLVVNALLIDCGSFTMYRKTTHLRQQTKKICTKKFSDLFVKCLKGPCSVHADRFMSSLELPSPLPLPLDYIFEP